MMTAVHDLYPNYVVSPSPYPRPPTRDVTLIAAATAEQFSGLFAKAAALVWGFRHLANDAEKLALELITRAVETTGDPNRYRHLIELSKKPPPRIGIRLTRRDNGLLIEVWDSDHNAPHVDAHLATVANMSYQWDWYKPSGGGKVIRAELGIPQPRQAEPSKRVPGWFSYPEPDEPVTALSDLEFLRKVRNGLYDMDTDWGHRGEL